jgi:fructokinase
MFAAAIAALGGNVELAAKVGSDPFGDHLIDTMDFIWRWHKWMLHDEKLFYHVRICILDGKWRKRFLFQSWC